MTVRGHNLGNITGPVQCWLGSISVVIFVVHCIYFFISKLPSAHPRFDGETLRAKDGVRVSRVMRLLFLGYASIRWIWCWSVRVAPLMMHSSAICGVVWAIFVTASTAFSVTVVIRGVCIWALRTFAPGCWWCIRSGVVDHCPRIPFFVPRLSGPFWCYRCRPLGLALVVFYWLHGGATSRLSSSVCVLSLRLMWTLGSCCLPGVVVRPNRRWGPPHIQYRRLIRLLWLNLPASVVFGGSGLYIFVLVWWPWASSYVHQLVYAFGVVL